jgi:ribosomal protein S18 acetylase RimI-like enzyme
MSDFQFELAPGAAAAPAIAASPAAQSTAAPAPAADFQFELAGQSAAPAAQPRAGADHPLFNYLLGQESGNKQFDAAGKVITSPKGAIGVAQVMPGTAPEAARLAGLPYDELRYRTDKAYNAALGSAYFNKQLADFGGDELKALAAYNAGPGAMTSALSRAKMAGTPDAWLRFLPAETQNYVPSIIAAARKAGVQPGAAAVDGGGAQAQQQPGVDPYSRDALPDEKTFLGTLKNSALGGAKSSQALAAQVGSLILNTAGIAPAVQQNLMAFAEGKNKEAGKLFGEHSSFTDAIGKDGDLSQWAAYAIGYLGYQVAESVVTGGVGAIIGKSIGKAAVKTLAEGLVEKEMAKLSASEAGKAMTKEQIGAAAAGKVAGQMGAASSIFANNIRQEGGSIYGDAVEQAGKTGEQVDIGRVWASALAAAGVDTAADLMMAKGLLGMKEGSTAGSYAKRLATEAPKGVVTQGGTEYVQTGIEQFGAKKDLFTPEAEKERIDSAAVGAFGGAAGGAGTALHQRTAALAPVADAAAAGGSLSKAAMAGNTPDAIAQQVGQEQAAAAQEAAANAPQADPIMDKARAIASSAREGGVIAKLQAEDKAGATKFVNDLAIAQSPSTPAAAREQALSRLEFAMEWAGQQVAPTVAPTETAAATDVPRSAPTTPSERRAGADRDKDLQDQINGASTAADKASAQAQAQTNREQRLGAPVATPEATPATPVAQPLAAGEQERLEGAALAGSEASRKAEDAPRQAVITAAHKAVAERGGVASPAEAQIFHEAGLGKPYDRIDPTLAAPLSTDEKLTQATGIALGNKPRESTRYNPQTPVLSETAEREAAHARSPSSSVEVGQGTRQGPPAAAPAPRAAVAPSVDSTLAALKTIPALRTAEQKAVADAARARYTAAQMAILQNAASSPFNLSAADKTELASLREAEVKQSAERAGESVPAPRVAIPAGPGTAVHRKRKATLRQLVDNGYRHVVRNDDGTFDMVNAHRQRFRLDGAADAVLARAQIAAEYRERADKSSGEEGDAVKARHDGMDLKIENPIGTTRSGEDPGGKPWSVKMTADYGELLHTEGADGDPVDLYVAPNPRHGAPVFVFDQYNDDGSFDEVKAVVGVTTQAQAEKIYDAHFSDGSGPRRRRAVTQMTVEEFKAWAKNPKTSKKPAAPVVMTAPEPIAPGAQHFTINVNGKQLELQRVRASELPETASAARGGKALRVTKAQAAMLRGIGALFGKKVEFFSDPSNTVGDGFVVPGASGLIYLNEATGISPLAVFGHELMHQLKADNPKAHAALEAVVAARLKTGARKVYTDLGYDQGSVLEEVTSDLGGDLMTDGSFWNDVFAKIRQDNGAQAQGIIAQLAAFINGALERLTKTIRQGNYKSAELVDNMAEIRAAFTTAVADYVRDQGLSQPEMQAQIEQAKQSAARKAVVVEQGGMKDSAVAKVGKRVVGRAHAWNDSNGDFVIMESAVHPDYRQRGIARQMYAQIEEKAGKQLKPAISLSDDAFEFWKRYRPEAVAGDLRHIKDQLVGQRAKKGDNEGMITKASGRGATLTFDDHPQGPGTTATLVGRDDINKALVAAGSEPVVPEGMAVRRSAERETPAEFDKWFGDSKAVGANGKPLVAYHGTAVDLSEFRTGREGTDYPGDIGAWFTAAAASSDEHELADSDARSAAISFSVDAAEESGGEARVMDVFLSIKSPKEYQGHDAFESALKKAGSATALRKALQAAGNDGIVIRDSDTDFGDLRDDWVAFNPEQIKSATGNNGEFDGASGDITQSRQREDFTDPESRIELSTTVPRAKGSEDKSYTENWVIDGDDIRASERHVDAIAKALRTYNTLSGKGNPKKLMAELHEVVVDNLLWLHDLVPADISKRARLWYDGANRIANDWTTKYDITERQAAGVLAVLSPQMDWFKNVSLGERVIDINRNRGREVWTKDMTAWVQSYVGAAKTVKDRDDRARLIADAKRLEGETLESMDLEDAARFTRIFDETYFERRYRLITPEGGFGDYVTKNDDGESSITWGGFSTIGKAVSILRSGSVKNIDKMLGGEHKVRNFYNNIVAPQSEQGHVTIDTHAIAAALVKALSGNTPEVKDNFGTAGSNAETGAGGSYGLFADAYRDAAAKRNVLPREMQSITWEAVRALFPAARKSQLAPKVSAVWDRVKAGELSRAEARNEIFNMAGGMEPMAWEGSDAGSFAADGATSFNSAIADNPADREARILANADTKDRISVTLSAATNSIPGIAELYVKAGKGDKFAHALLQDIAADSLRHLMAGTSAKLVVDRSTGLYGGASEPSLGMTVTFTDNDSNKVLAALAKFADNFNQEQVHVRKPTTAKLGTVFEDGSYATLSYRWDLKQALTAKQIQKVIDESGLYGLTFGDDFVEAYYVGDVNNDEQISAFKQAIERAAERLGKSSSGSEQSVARLWPYGHGEGTIGYERIRGDVAPGPSAASQTARRVAEYLNGQEKVKAFEQAAEVSPEQAALQREIGDAYEALPDNDLKRPQVKRAYTELAKELVTQFKALPIKVEIWKGDGEPYANSKGMRQDILDNNHMFVYGTGPESFGPEGVDFTGHPLLEQTGLEDVNGTPLLMNDLLRTVHDYFAHGMSETQFGPKGEEAAWKNHMATTSNPWARWALTSETRGQNSWVNFRSGLDQSLSAKERGFARQKAALLPVEFSLTGDRKVDKPMKDFIAAMPEKARQGSLPAAKRSIERPQVDTQIDEAGAPEFSSHDLFIGYGNPTERFDYIPADPSREKMYQLQLVEPTTGEFLGYTDLLFVDGKLKALYDIEVNKEGRSKGVGVRAIKTLLASQQNVTLDVSNIVTEARGFWERVGIPQQNLEDGAAYDGKLDWNTFAATRAAADAGRARAADGRGPGALRQGEPGASGEAGQDQGPGSEARLSRDRVTGTPEFKRWFGDSKVVDDQGKPLVVYHGTSGDFSQFSLDAKKGEPTYTHGFYFSPSPGYAAVYGGRDGANVMPVYLSLKHPLVIDQDPVGKVKAVVARVLGMGKRLDRLNKMLSDKTSSAFLTEDDVAELKALGYDGLMNHGRNEFIAFDPTQIKSATGNSGAFDPAQADITRSADRTGTPAFKAWFRESKIVDADGKPKVVYTGTSADVDFKSFKAPKNGIWFTDSTEGASQYAVENDSMGHIFEGGKYVPKNTASRVIPVYLSIQNPKVYAEWPDVIKYASNYKKAQGALWEQLKRAGHDGVVFRDATHGDVFVAFESAQVKSAIGNDGGFDPSKKDITRSRDRAAWDGDRIDQLMSKYAYTQDDNRTKAYAGWVSPKDFLAATTPAAERARLESEATPLDAAELKKQSQEIFLEGKIEDDSPMRGSFKVTGHEGRHRMMALAKAGVERVPVVYYVGTTDDAKPLTSLFATPQRWAHDKAEQGFLTGTLTPISWAHRAELKEKFMRPDASVKFSAEREHLIIHAGSDFDQLDAGYLGKGEGAGGMQIRPLGNGLYGYLARDAEEAERAVKQARAYLKYAPTKERAIHAFRVKLGAGDVQFGQVWDDELQTAADRESRADWAAANEIPAGPERLAAFEALDKKYPRSRLAPTRPFRTEVLSGPNLIEIAANDLSRLERAGKWPAETDDKKIASDLRTMIDDSAAGGEMDFDRAAAILKKGGIALDKTQGVPSLGRPDVYGLRKWGTQEKVDPKTLTGPAALAWERLQAGDAKRSADRGIYYSQLSSALAAVPERLATQAAPAWAQWLKANAGKMGVKADELEWSGVFDMLKMRGRDKISKDELATWVDENGVQVGETVLGRDPSKDAAMREAFAGTGYKIAVDDYGDAAHFIDPDGEDIDYRDLPQHLKDAVNKYGPETVETKYATYTVPGGDNYREVLITLPDDSTTDAIAKRLFGKRWVDLTDEENVAAVKEMKSLPDRPKPYTSGHWDQKNILAHLRLDDRTDADGNKVLFVNEIQSDWGQQAKRIGFAKKLDVTVRKSTDETDDEDTYEVVVAGNVIGFVHADDDALALKKAHRTYGESELTKGAPAGPFVADTKSWVALAMKRALVEAARGDYDKVAFINGKQAADLYSLRKQIDQVVYYDDKTLVARKDGANVFKKQVESDSELDDIIGKEVARKLLDTKRDMNSQRILSGVELEVGGEGMKAFYDGIVPQVARDLAKKLGGKVGETSVGAKKTKYIIEEVWNDTGNVDWVAEVDSRAAAEAKLSAIEEDDDYGESTYRIAEEVEDSAAAAANQLAIDITPAMREQLEGGAPLFSKERTTGHSGRAYTPEQEAMFRNIGRTTEEKSLKERLKEARQDIGKKMAQGLVDQFRPLKDLGGEAYTLARLSKGAAGAFEALLHHGKLKLVDNAYDADMTGGFIEKVGNPLGAELEDFMQWIAANRAEKLSKEDREHLFTAEDIAAGKSLADGQLARPYTMQDGSTTTDRAAAYRDSLEKFNEFNKNTMDMAEQSGLIDGEARKFWESEFYVPFYRVSEEDGAFMGSKIKGGIARQQAFKKLKGGKDKLSSDLLSNTLQNWSHLIDAAAKNRAARATLEAAQNVGVAIEASEDAVREMGKSTGNKNGVVWFMDGGKQRHFLVEDPYVLAAINSLEYAGLKGPLMDALSTMKHWLTAGVTASPAFKVRNLIRDTIQAIGTSGLSYNPVKNIADGLKHSARDSQEYVSALASGGLIRFGTMMDGNASERIRQLVKRGVKESTILNNPEKVKAFYDKFVDPAVQAYHEIGNRGEEINRSALYSQLRKQGVGHAEASLMARDLMDFSMQGTWASIRFLTQVVPFMNARLQGLYKLGRAAQEDPRRFAMVTGAVALVSVALMAAYGDDEDWKKREDFDRDGFWWFKLGGTAFRIPKPFEIGAIATLAERGVELFTNKEFTATRFRDRLLHIASDNLSMNPIPQAVKPIIDVYSNKDAFTGRPIETAGMEKLKSEYRYNSGTSMVARAASTALNSVTSTVGAEGLSPVQIDSLLKGYFGWLGTFVVSGADMAIRPMTNEPTRPEADYLRVVTQGIVRSLPEPSSKYVSSVYEQAKALEQAYATHRQLMKEGKAEDAKAFAKDHAEELARYTKVEHVKQAQAKANQSIHDIERSAASPAEKRDRIQAIRDRQSDNAKAIY